MNAAARPLTPSRACGQSQAHESAVAQVCGLAPYIDDLPLLAGTLFAAPILSPVAHGRIRSVDETDALQEPGVWGVVLDRDVPGEHVMATHAHDEPVFAHDTVEYAGHVIGLVVADSVAAARRGARRVRLDIEELPALLSVQQAIEAQSYVLPPVRVRRGDPDQALAQAPHRLEGSLEVGGQEHFYLEGQIAYAIPREKVWLMPEGTSAPALGKRRIWLVEICKEYGFHYSDRLHVQIWGSKKGV